MEDDRTCKIRDLNDQLRTTFIGGRILITAGIAALSEELQAEMLAAVAEFDAFDEDNDPHGEHDCAVVQVQTLSVIWKIDYFDKTWSFLSPDPANSDATRRVLTIMLAEEY